MMKKLIIIAGMVLITNSALTQNSRKVEKLSEKMSGEICECLNDKIDFEDVDTSMEVFVDCYLKSLKANKKEVEKRVIKRKSSIAKMNAMYDLSISIGVNLGLNCDQFLNFVMKNKDDIFDNDNQSGVYGTY